MRNCANLYRRHGLWQFQARLRHGTRGAGEVLPRAWAADLKRSDSGVSRPPDRTWSKCVDHQREALRDAKLVDEVKRAGVISHEDASQITDIPNVRERGTRLGNWLTKEQAKDF